MRRLLTLAAFVASSLAVPAAANVARAEATTDGAERAVVTDALAAPQGGAAYGPFRVVDGTRAALVDATDSQSPAAFATMLREHPSLTTLELVDCPGTDDDTANLALGRMIRKAGLATHVPANGSVRSGAVELFLAGSRRLIEDGAEFAVHAWRDSEGRQPGDFPADDPVNRAYIEYYGEMGVARPQAFYDMTNAMPNDAARWLTAQDMRAWIGEARPGDVTVDAPVVAQLDLAPAIP